LTLIDLDPIKSTQQALQDKELRIKSLLERIDEGLICITRDGHIKTINPAAETIFGYVAGQLTGQRIDHLLPQVEFPPIQDDNLGKTRTVETQGRHVNGGELTLQLRITPMQLEHRFYYSLIINRQ
jgi:PAS domain S-box-containing protein